MTRRKNRLAHKLAYRQRTARPDLASQANARLRPDARQRKRFGECRRRQPFFTPLNSNTAGRAARPAAAGGCMRDSMEPADFEKRWPDRCSYRRSVRISYGNAGRRGGSQAPPDEGSERQGQGRAENQTDVKPILSQRLLRRRAWPMRQLFQMIELFRVFCELCDRPSRDHEAAKGQHRNGDRNNDKQRFRITVPAPEAQPFVDSKAAMSPNHKE